MSDIPSERLGKIASSAEAKTVHVLYVDDYLDALPVVRQMLELQGSFQIEAASSVTEALQKMKHAEFDVVISDYLMPEKSGLDFLGELRETGNDIPFILFTGQGREEVAIKALNLGADHYVNKIGKPETVYGELAHAIRQAVDKKRVEKNLKMLSSVVEQSSSSIVILDNKEKIVYVNPKFLELHDVAFEDTIGKKWEPWVASGTTLQDEKQGIRNTVFKQKKIWSKDIFNILKDGKKVWRRAIIFPLVDENENITHVVYVGEDITEQRKTEQTIWDREERLRAILASSPDAMIVTDLHGNITDCNLETLNLLGFSSKAEILGKDYYALLVPGDQKKVKNAVKELFEHEILTNLECTLLTTTGKKVPVEYSANILKDSNGNAVGAIGLARDITERKKAEERYRTQFEENLDAIFLADPKTGILVDCNRAATALIGRDKSELVGQPQRILHPPEKNVGKFSKVFEQFLKHKQDFIETQIVTKNGEIRDVMIRASSFKLGDKPIIQGIFRDITERKRMEQQLKESEEKHRIMIEQAPDAIFTFDMNGTVTSCNTAGLSFTGFSEDELVGKLFSEFVPKVDSSTELLKLYDSLFSGGLPEPFQVNFLTKSGDLFFGEVHTSLLKKGNRITGFQAIVRDITERKKAEKALRDSEKRFRELSEMLPEVIFEADNNGNVIFVNRESYSKFGYTKEEFAKGISATVFIAPEDRERAKKSLAKLLSGEKTGPTEYVALRKDGTKFPISISSNPIIHDGKVVGFRGLMVDITERKKAEEAIKQSEKRFRELSEMLPEVIFETDLKATVIFANHEAYSKFGYTKEEFEKGINAAQFIVPEQRDRVMKNHVRLLSGKKTGPSEYRAIRKDGTTFPIIVNSSPVYRENRVVGARGVLTDITEHMKAEETLKETLTKMETLNEKLGVVGKFTRHDARNKLSVIMNNIFLAKKQLGGNEFASSYLDVAESTIGQIEKIFDFARIYEKLGTEKLSDINVKQIVNEAFMLASRSDDIELVNECEGLTVRADSLLRQFFYNLIDNSQKYGEKVTQIRVYYKQNKNKLTLIYEDNGVGISVDEKQKIFAEGYGKGTGYGLYLIEKICQVYGWSIQETGEFGKGAQFTITIPKN